jgi:hypothetical protein
MTSAPALKRIKNARLLSLAITTFPLPVHMSLADVPSRSPR